MIECEFPETSDYCYYSAGVVCKLEPDVGEEGALRLQNNRTSEEYNRISGNLEVFHDGAWGDVCSDGFGANESKVVCHQLGFYDEGTWTFVRIQDSQRCFLDLRRA